MIYDMIWNTS